MSGKFRPPAIPRHWAFGKFPKVSKAKPTKSVFAHGGPFDGKRIRLSANSDSTTAYIRVGKWRGRYKTQKIHPHRTIWEEQ